MEEQDEAKGPLCPISFSSGFAHGCFGSDLCAWWRPASRGCALVAIADAMAKAVEPDPVSLDHDTALIRR